MEMKMGIEEQVSVVARNAKHNLKLIKRTPTICNPEDLDKNIKFLEMMVRLHKTDLKAQKNARRAGRALSLRTRLKSLLSSILADERRKRKEGTA
ncbi:hypothetical protein [Paenibacillus dokdonensis]|uniref:hypothetical protein n=1 Tax=Paenibacillus dokdonensis TaxID=2567944 RepID=UPI001457B0AB|nr:hypothetical protein [Paenibacillus dokdonensis]